MAAERLTIIVDERGARQVQRALENVGKAGRRAAGSTDLLRRAVTGIGAGLAVRGIKNVADGYTSMRSQVKLVTKDQAQANQVFDKLHGIANDTRSGLGNTVQVYQRLARAGKRLGVSQQDVLDVTSNLNKATVVMSATNTEATNALIQLSQGFGKGRLDGEELKSVMEQLPILGDILAKELGKPVNEIRQMGAAGEITGEIMFKAFGKGGKGIKELERQFALSAKTIDQGLNVLKNEFTVVFGEFLTESGAIGIANRALVLLADNMETVLKVSITLASAIGTVLARGAITLLIKQMVKLTLVMLANPLFALLTLIPLVVTAMSLFGDEIEIAGTNGATLAAVMRSFFAEAKKALVSLANVVSKAFSVISDVIADVLGVVSLSFKDVVILAATFSDAVIKIFAFLGKSIGIVFSTGPKAVADLILQLANFMIKITEDAIAISLKQIRKVIELAAKINPVMKGVLKEIERVEKATGKGLSDAVKFGRIENPIEGAASQFAEEFGNAFDALGDAGPIQKFFERVFDNAVLFTKKKGPKLKSALDEALGDNKPPGAKGKGKGGKDRVSGLIKEFESLENALFPVLAARRELNKAEAIAAELVVKGQISTERATAMLKGQEEALRDQLDPVGAKIRALKEELVLEDLRAQGREGELNFLKEKAALEKTLGAPISAEEEAMLRKYITMLKEVTKETTFLEKASQMAFDGITGGLADMVAEWDKDAFKFKDLVKQMVRELTKMLIQMAIVRGLLGLGVSPIAINRYTGQPAPTGSATGGRFQVGPGGGVDGQVAMLRVSQGEQVDVTTRKQRREMEGSGGRTEVIVVDNNTEAMTEALNSAAFDDASIRFIDKNLSTIKRKMGIR